MVRIGEIQPSTVEITHDFARLIWRFDNDYGVMVVRFPRMMPASYISVIDFHNPSDGDAYTLESIVSPPGDIAATRCTLTRALLQNCLATQQGRERNRYALR